MMKALLIAALLVFSFAQTASAQSDEMEAVRKLYALAEAGDEYCPDIKLKFGVRMAIADTWGYRPPTSEEEINKLEAIKANLFSRFRKGGSRSYVCELLMQEYGPGGQIELFAFR